MSSCTKEDFGISSIENPYSDALVSMYGETITVSFVAEAAWDAELVLGAEGEWAKITQKKGAEKAGTGRVQIRFNANQSADERVAELYVTVSGFFCTLFLRDLSPLSFSTKYQFCIPCSLRNKRDCDGLAINTYGYLTIRILYDRNAKVLLCTGGH